MSMNLRQIEYNDKMEAAQARNPDDVDLAEITGIVQALGEL